MSNSKFLFYNIGESNNINVLPNFLSYGIELSGEFLALFKFGF